jgi:hypothetical protein
MKRAPLPLDLSDLAFLQYGDMTRIAREMTEERTDGKRVAIEYVSKVCKGKHRNDRILMRAFAIALERKSKFPIQALRK